MHIVAIAATPKKRGNIVELSHSVLKGAEEQGHTVEFLNLYDYTIKDCISCWRCVDSEHCILKDDFAELAQACKKADTILLASPVYWGNITGRMKTFFDRHTGEAMVKPTIVREAHDFPFRKKLKTFFDVMRNLGPYREWAGKRYIIVTASTVPLIPGYLSGDIKNTIASMKIYIKKLNGHCVGKIIYADSLFRFNPKKRDKIIQKAYRLGKNLH